MKIKDKVIVVTGGASGIGRALCRRFQIEEAAQIIVADLNEAGAKEVASEVGGAAYRCDVADENDIKHLVDETYDKFGRIDLFCSNAGIGDTSDIDTPNEQWQKMWDINFMSRLYAARAVIPRMIEAGGGYLLNTASAAGLLTEVGSATYSATKHADVAFSEWLSIRYGHKGIKVSCLCPQGVETNLLEADSPVTNFLKQTAITADEAADCVVKTLEKEEFLVLPHPEVAQYCETKATQNERWLGGMRRIRQKLFGDI